MVDMNEFVKVILTKIHITIQNVLNHLYHLVIDTIVVLTDNLYKILVMNDNVILVVKNIKRMFFHIMEQENILISYTPDFNEYF